MDCLLVFVVQWSDSACGTSCHYYWVCWLVQLVFVIIHRLALFSASTLERVPNETNLYFAPRITIGKYHPCLCHCTQVWSVIWLLFSSKSKVLSLNWLQLFIWHWICFENLLQLQWENTILWPWLQWSQATMQITDQGWLLWKLRNLFILSRRSSNLACSEFSRLHFA